MEPVTVLEFLHLLTESTSPRSVFWMSMAVGLYIFFSALKPLAKYSWKLMKWGIIIGVAVAWFAGLL